MQVDKMASAGWCLGPPLISCGAYLSQPQISVCKSKFRFLARQLERAQRGDEHP